jgi:hypothetical protein
MILTREHLLVRREQLTTALSELAGAVQMIDELLEYEAQAVVGPTPEESKEG